MSLPGAHPSPLPKGEGEAMVDLRHFCNARFAYRLTTILPLPLGEGWGEGDLGNAQLPENEMRPVES